MKKFLKGSPFEDIQNDLLTLEHGSKQLHINEIITLKANTLFGPEKATEKNLVLISDFQDRMASQYMDTVTTVRKHLVQLSKSDLHNVAIDSVYFGRCRFASKKSN